jgi:hypothetical protein
MKAHFHSIGYVQRKLIPNGLMQCEACGVHFVCTLSDVTVISCVLFTTVANKRMVKELRSVAQIFTIVIAFLFQKN